MRGWDPLSAAAKLEMAMEALQHARASALAQWDDDQSRQFDEQFLAPLETKVRRALDAIHHLAEALSKAERECS
jgi:hypothetical protein